MECLLLSRFVRVEAGYARRVARIYTCDVVKRLGTYRVERDVLADAASVAAERGETVTDVLVRALEAYIRAHRTGGIASAAPVNEPPVYTDVESPVSYDEPACRHPADAVEANECGICHADVW